MVGLFFCLQVSSPAVAVVLSCLVFCFCGRRNETTPPLAGMQGSPTTCPCWYPIPVSRIVGISRQQALNQVLLLSTGIVKVGGSDGDGNHVRDFSCFAAFRRRLLLLLFLFFFQNQTGTSVMSRHDCEIISYEMAGIVVIVIVFGRIAIAIVIASRLVAVLSVVIYALAD